MRAHLAMSCLSSAANASGVTGLSAVPASSTPYVPKSSHRLNREESNLAAALQFGAAAQPPGQSGRLVLVTDGRQTRGDVLQAAEGSSLEVDCVPIPEDREPEVLVEELRCPSSVAEKTPFDLVATIAATQASRGADLQLLRNGKPAGRFRVDLKEGRNVFLLPQDGEKEGVGRYEVRGGGGKGGEVAKDRGSGLTRVEGPWITWLPPSFPASSWMRWRPWFGKPGWG